MPKERVVSTVPPDERSHSLRDGLLRLFSKKPDLVNFRVEGASHWKKYIPFSRETAAAILLRDLPPSTKINLILKKNGQGRIEIGAEGIFRASDSIGEDGRPFDLKMGEVGKGRLMIEESYQGGSIGRNLMRNEIEFFRACGVKSFNIHAGFAAGGYAWARFGFLPDSVNSANFKIHTKDAVKNRYAILRPFLADEVRSVLDDAVKFKEGRDLWRVADQRADIGHGLRKVFNEIAHGKGTEISPEASCVRDLFVKGCGFQVLNYIQSRLEAGKDVALGQILLAGTSWQGHLDLNNVEQMRRADKYIGK